MDKDEIYYLIIDLLHRLIAIPRISREEHEAATEIVNFLQPLLPSSTKLKRVKNNIILTPERFDESLPTVLLNSHIDTVKPVAGWTTSPFEPILNTDEDTLQGIGSNDAGASLVSLLGTFLYFATNGGCPRYNLVFVASAEEEVSGRDGFEAVIPFLPHIDFAIVGEPTGMNPAVAEKGLVVIDGVVHGKSGHAARDEGDNAIYKAMPVVSALRSLHFPLVSEWLGPVKISVTQINAGTQHNVVPDRCDFVVDVRTTDAYTNAETFEMIVAATPAYCVLTPRSLRLNPSGIDISNPVVQKLILLGKEPHGSPTLSDQALMPWPSVKVGPGDSARSHTANEFIRLQEIREALEIYISLLR